MGQFKDLRSLNAGYVTALEDELGDITIPDQLLNRTRLSQNKSFNFIQVSAKSKDTYHKLRIKNMDTGRSTNTLNRKLSKTFRLEGAYSQSSMRKLDHTSFI